MNTGGNHAPLKAQATYGNSTCLDSNIRYLDGGSYQADAGKNVTRTTPAQTWLWAKEPSLISQNSTSVPEFSLPDPSIPLLIAFSAFIPYIATDRSRRGSADISS